MIDAIEKAMQEVDLIITTGSVSMGDRDMLKPILTEVFNATIHFGIYIYIFFNSIFNILWKLEDFIFIFY